MYYIHVLRGILLSDLHSNKFRGFGPYMPLVYTYSVLTYKTVNILKYFPMANDSDQSHRSSSDQIGAQNNLILDSLNELIIFVIPPQTQIFLLQILFSLYIRHRTLKKKK
jgi:hypothetical protein